MSGLAPTQGMDPTPEPLREPGTRVLQGPTRMGSELRWRAVTRDGTPIVVAQLLPELARDVSLRRRWLRDVERVRGLTSPAVARTLRIGPAPDPADSGAPPPWRVREDPPGETVDELLTRRAPLPADEAAALVARIADAIHGVHAEGAVLRDMAPRRIVLAEDGTVRLTDIGLARVDILSTRTAASLILEGSAYASPEQIERTIIDQRSDVYGLGVLLYRALTAALPHGETPAILRGPEPPPPPSKLRPAIGTAFDAIVSRCLAIDPAERPDSAAELAAILRGERVPVPLSRAALQCQGCGAALPVGQRLCLRCGKLAVRFAHADDGPGQELRLVKVDEQADTIAALRTRLEALSAGRLPALNFLVGDQRMYSKRERDRLLRLPIVLFDRLDGATAHALRRRIEGPGCKLVVAPQGSLVKPSPVVYGVLGAIGVVALVALMVMGASSSVLAFVSLLFLAAIVLGGIVAKRRRPQLRAGAALLRLRPAAAALPASDPLVRRLAALLTQTTPRDLRDHVGRLALAVQRLVDHRAENLREAAEIDAVTEPVVRLVDLVEAQVRRVAAIDADLADLDEGRLVRDLATLSARAPQATPEAAAPTLERLDRLRTLEDERARAFHRLLEASSLVHRAIELGLAVKDERLEHERQIRLALAVLGE